MQPKQWFSFPRWQLPSWDEQVLLALLSGIIGIAWFLLWQWSIYPHSRYISDASGVGIGWISDTARAIPTGEVLLPVIFYVGLWLLMCAAMMTPTTLPLLLIWHRLVARHRDRALLQGLVVAGYLSAWGVFGLLAVGMDTGLHQFMSANPWFATHGWMLGAGTFALAGLFQFSSLKNHCLEQCRSPFSFALAAWQSPGLRWQSWKLGVRHGLYCVGCCWALMLLMFGVGMGNLGWMLLLGMIMATEKNLPWGYRLRQPLGVALLVGGLGVVAINLV